ncbi:hypothetical protein GB928_021770 [Shinella curvata]|uniref:Uncharacterized protein n=1 Tax=Shinella curvata TaxID=1817964 RepID=A0ABT8XKQ3_9HYPH|nr:hypothetical protein [Shinella curvata]MCJ8052751.1 hypothetical protein [Shinella curvata]MDO6123831.1 hypothetical protein [Shinella curvata]
MIASASDNAAKQKDGVFQVIRFSPEMLEDLQGTASKAVPDLYRLETDARVSCSERNFSFSLVFDWPHHARNSQRIAFLSHAIPVHVRTGH